MHRLAAGIFIAGLLVLASLAVAEAPVVRLSEPVAVDGESESFGALVPDEPLPLPLAEVLAAADRYLDGDVIFSARIGKVCRKKGCFFIARDGDAVVRVTFKDYGFFIPTDSGGKRAVFQGTLHRETVTKSAAEHYAEDLGDADAGEVEAGLAYTIVASAIRIGS
jgi:hypothetical protein